jgi:hypothetical protein
LKAHQRSFGFVHFNEEIGARRDTPAQRRTRRNVRGMAEIDDNQQVTRLLMTGIDDIQENRVLSSKVLMPRSQYDLAVASART